MAKDKDKDKDKDHEEKVKKALKSKAVEIQPKGTLEDIQKKIDKKKKGK